MSAAVIPLRAAAVRAIVRERDALDPDDPRYRELDQQAYEALLWWACGLDLTGLEVWWGNGGCCDGRVTRVEDDPERGKVLFTGEPGDDEKPGDDDEENGFDLCEVLSAGWLQEVDDDAGPGPDGYLATIRALERREVRS